MSRLKKDLMFLVPLASALTILVAYALHRNMLVGYVGFGPTVMAWFAIGVVIYEELVRSK